MSETSLSSKTSVRRVTFTVSDVSAAEGLLHEFRHDVALTLAHSNGLEACSDLNKPLVDVDSTHPFMTAVHLAFADHRPLVITPDHIWLLICQGFACHVNANAQALRHFFVAHEGKKALKVRRDDFRKGAPDNAWDEMIAEFSQQIKASLSGDIYELLMADFSTTGFLERTAFEVTLMDTFQDYFDFIAFTMCGIPSITLEGSPQDWRSILERAQKLAQYDLQWWIDELAPVLNEFVLASEGHVNVPFWQSIYKDHDISGGPIITGWLVKFFPYRVSTTGDFSKPEREYRRNPFLNHEYSEDEPFTGFHLGDTGTGLSMAPVQWKYLDETYNMLFVAGFIGVSQDHESKALRAEIGWAIKDVTANGAS